MKRLRQQPGSAATREASDGRRNFLRHAGLAAAVVGGLEAVGMSSAMAATSRKYSAHKFAGAVHPRSFKPGPETRTIMIPDCTCNITWTCTPGQCGNGGCPHPEWCYHWFDSCNGAFGGPLCNFSSCATHVQCGIQ
jgi:hypothetical protein